MIGSLRGVLCAQLSGGAELLVDVNGVGYRVTAPPSWRSATEAVGDEVFLHVHTHVREDAIVLYGFATEEERRCFEALIGAHGVGPSLAVAVLSSLSPSALVKAVLEDDATTLCHVPGIGKKTAARLLIDLKSRLSVPDLGADGPIVSGAERTPTAEVRAALDELGYRPEEIRRVLDGAPADLGVEELLRLSLRELASR